MVEPKLKAGEIRPRMALIGVGPCLIMDGINLMTATGNTKIAIAKPYSYVTFCFITTSHSKRHSSSNNGRTLKTMNTSRTPQ